MTAAPPRPPRLAWVTLAYTAIALVVTWPLAAGLTRDVPGDLGDALLNIYILRWGADHLPGLFLGGERWAAFWNASIFHPEPFTLALSEHMTAQAIVAAPIIAVTGNAILAYNVIFLSTFVLSAIGAYLLARDLTGDWRAGLIAGLVYGFLPYRMAQVAHVQVLSSQWMPFALWGMHRFIAHGSRRALAGGTAALVLQHWSCGYYVLYFAPFTPLFALHEMWRHGRLRDARMWTGLIVAAVVTAACTIPFLLPYLDAREAFGLTRPLGEVIAFSANVWSYATAPENLHVWGRTLHLHRHAEGQTFLGLVAALLALVGLLASLRASNADGPRASRLPLALSEAPRPGSGRVERPPAAIALPLMWRRRIATVFFWLAVVQGAAFASTFLAGGFNLRIAGLTIRATSPQRLALQTLVAIGVVLLASSSARQRLRRWLLAPETMTIGLMVLAMWLSLGPTPMTGPTLVPGMGIYGVLYDHVPGFDGVRVPARYAMIAGLFLALSAAFGARWLVRRSGGTAWLALAGVLIVLEGLAAPLEVNGTWGMKEATPPPRVYRDLNAPPVYQALADLQTPAIVAEFPFGDPAWEIRYTYYAGMHRRRILNGYSGAFPPAYQRRVAAFNRLDADPAAAWSALVDAGATHVILHRDAFADPARANLVHDWLIRNGAHAIAQFPDGTSLFELRS